MSYLNVSMQSMGIKKIAKVHDLATVLCEFDQTERKSFLTFLTGCPHLPAGGLKNLSPQICVYIRRSHQMKLAISIMH